MVAQGMFHCPKNPLCSVHSPVPARRPRQPAPFTVSIVFSISFWFCIFHTFRSPGRVKGASRSSGIVYSKCVYLPWNINASAPGQFPSFPRPPETWGSWRWKLRWWHLALRRHLSVLCLSLPQYPHHSNEDGRRFKSKYDQTGQTAS